MLRRHILEITFFDCHLQQNICKDNHFFVAIEEKKDELLPYTNKKM